MKRWIVIAGLLGVVVGWARANPVAAQAKGGGDSGGGIGGIPQIITPVCPNSGGPPHCARCTPSGGCTWACYGGYFCTQGQGFCANGVDCRT